MEGTNEGIGPTEANTELLRRVQELAKEVYADKKGPGDRSILEHCLNVYNEPTLESLEEKVVGLFHDATHPAFTDMPLKS